MSLTNKYMNRMFRRVADLVWDLTSGQVGVQTADGIHTFSIDADGNASVNVNPFESFGVPIPAFATRKSLADVQQGDLIVGDKNILGWVVDKTTAALKLHDHNGNGKTYTPPKVGVLGIPDGVLVVQNLLNLTGSQEGMQGFAGSLMPLLMLQDGSGEGALEKILPFMLMQQTTGTQAGGAGGFNPLMLLALQGKGGKGKGLDLSDPMTLMMMGGFGGGAGGFNPLMLLALQGGDDTPAATPLVAPGIPPLRRL